MNQFLKSEEAVIAAFSLISIGIMVLASYWPPPNHAGEIWTLCSTYIGYAMAHLFGKTTKEPKP